MIFLKRFKKYINNMDGNNCVNQINKRNTGYGSGIVEVNDDNSYQLYTKIYNRTIHISLYIQIRNKHKHIESIEDNEPIFAVNVNIGFSKDKNGIFTNCKYFIDDVLQQCRIPAKKIGNIDTTKLLGMVKQHGELFLSYRF